MGGVFLRLASLDTMSTMLNWDEAWEDGYAGKDYDIWS